MIILEANSTFRKHEETRLGPPLSEVHLGLGLLYNPMDFNDFCDEESQKSLKSFEFYRGLFRKGPFMGIGSIWTTLDPFGSIWILVAI